MYLFVPTLNLNCPPYSRILFCSRIIDAFSIFIIAIYIYSSKYTINDNNFKPFLYRKFHFIRIIFPSSSIWDRNLDRIVILIYSRIIFLEESCNIHRQEFVWRSFLLWKVILLESTRGGQKGDRDRERETKKGGAKKGRICEGFSLTRPLPCLFKILESAPSKWFHGGGGISGGLCAVRNFIRMIDEKNRATILSLPPDKCNSILPAIDGGRFSQTSHLKGTDLFPARRRRKGYKFF